MSSWPAPNWSGPFFQNALFQGSNFANGPKRLTATKSRTAVTRFSKMLRDASNGCFWEAAMQHRDILPTSALGRTRIVTLPYLAPSIGLICITNAPAHSPSLRLSSSDNGCSTASTVLVLTHSWNFGCSKRSSNCSVQPRRMKYTYRTGPMVSVE